MVFYGVREGSLLPVLHSLTPKHLPIVSSRGSQITHPTACYEKGSQCLWKSHPYGTAHIAYNIIQYMHLSLPCSFYVSIFFSVWFEIFRNQRLLNEIDILAHSSACGMSNNGFPKLVLLQIFSFFIMKLKHNLN